LIWLVSAAGCSITIALILKINEVRGGDRVLLAGANYIVAAALSFVLLGPGLECQGAVTFTLGAIAGIDYVLGFLLLMYGISRGPLSVPVTVMRLSVAVPVAVSIFIWAEHPGPPQWLGIALGIAAIVLFGYGLPSSSSRPGTGGGYWLLILSLFMVMGIGDTLLKAIGELSPDTNRLLFASVLFTVAAVFTWVLILIRRIPFDRPTFLLGLLLGVPNLFSTVFILMALRNTPASIAFPFVNLTVILGSTLLAFLIWKERLSRLATAGLALAAVALVLLPLR
jgi:drug/metabolite transporter (DMT)-like permease